MSSVGMAYEVRECDWSAYVCFFFFKQKTAYEIKECDWSSDVCSSDLSCKSGIRLDASPAERSGHSSTNRVRFLRLLL